MGFHNYSFDIMKFILVPCHDASSMAVVRTGIIWDDVQLAAQLLLATGPID